MNANDTHDHMLEEVVVVPVVDAASHLAVLQALQDQLASLDMTEDQDCLAHQEKMHHHSLLIQLEELVAKHVKHQRMELLALKDLQAPQD